MLKFKWYKQLFRCFLLALNETHKGLRFIMEIALHWRPTLLLNTIFPIMFLKLQKQSIPITLQGSDKNLFKVKMQEELLQFCSWVDDGLKKEWISIYVVYQIIYPKMSITNCPYHIAFYEICIHSFIPWTYLDIYRYLLWRCN